MKIKDYGLEFPKEKSVDALYNYIYKLTEVLEIVLSSIGEDNLTEELKKKITGGEE